MRQNPNHIISCGIGADISQSMEFIRGFEDNAAGGNNIRLIPLQGCQGAFPDYHQFLIGVAVRWMWRLTGIQGRDVAFEITQGGRGGIKHCPPRADAGRLDLQIGPVEDARMHHWL